MSIESKSIAEVADLAAREKDIRLDQDRRWLSGAMEYGHSSCADLANDMGYQIAVLTSGPRAGETAVFAQTPDGRRGEEIDLG